MTGGSGGGISLVFADARFLKLAGGQMAGNVTCAGAQTFDGVDLSAIASTYLPLAGGQMAGNVTCAGAQTFDGVDLSAIATTYLKLAGAQSITGDFSLDASHIKLDRAPGSDHESSGFGINDVVGENVVVGDLLYLKSDSKWWKADADAVASMPGLAIARGSISADAGGELLLLGIMRDDSWGYTAGAILYADVTPGPPTETTPSGSGDQVQVVGRALTATTILFIPNPDLTEIA